MLHKSASPTHLHPIGLHPEEIKARIRMKGTTPSAIASALGVCRMTVSQVIHMRGVSAKIAKHISSVIGVPVGDIWPGKYPHIEFVERAGLAGLVTAAQAEADLKRAAPRARRASARKAVA